MPGIPSSLSTVNSSTNPVLMLLENSYFAHCFMITASRVSDLMSDIVICVAH